jgi:hypothetical protein
VIDAHPDKNSSDRAAIETRILIISPRCWKIDLNVGGALANDALLPKNAELNQSTQQNYSTNG